MKCPVSLHVPLAIAGVVLVLVSGCAAVLEGAQDHARAPLQARAAVSPDDPVAVIGYLPPEVSNGTWQSLDGTGSHATVGIIINYTWSIEFKNTTRYIYVRSDQFKFVELGLYKISLTVRDTGNRTGVAFSAVYSILDSDEDSLPDWWEIHYFDDLNQTGLGDPDRDGYTNLQEYASGTDPTKKDPQPGLVQMMADNWMYLVIIAAAIVAAVLILLPRYRKRQDRQVKKKIEVAIEIEKELEKES